MLRLIKAFLFKISRDITFRITLIIGVALALTSTLGLFAIGMLIGGNDAQLAKQMLNGQSMLVNSLSPAQNFGIAIPVNLISFIALEFNHGTIRNKIIAGNSKFNIYSSLFISGLFFAFALLLVYVGLCTGISSLIGGFDPNGEGAALLGGGSTFTPSYIGRMVVVGLLTYVSLVSFTVFIITLFRNIGPSIPVVIVLILALYFVGAIISPLAELAKELDDISFDGVVWAARILDPLYAISSSETKIEFIDSEHYEVYKVLSNETFITGIINNVVYTGIFFAAGSLIFRKRDVK